MATYKRWIVLAVVGTGLFLITLDNSILYTALPTLTKALGADYNESLWIMNAYPLVMAGLLLATGTLGDRIGHKKLFIAGLIIFGIASALAAFASSPLMLIGARALLAVGAASMMPATLALIRLTFTKSREFNMAIAIWGSLAVLGSALGPIIGGLLLEWFWWGSVFLVNVPFVLLALFGATIVAPASHQDTSKPWDLLSSFQFMVGLASLVLFVKEITKITPSVPVIVVSGVLALIGLWVFTRRQKKLEQPLLDLSIFRRPVVLAGVFGASIAMFAMAGIQLITTQRFQLVADFSPIEAGLLLVTIGAGSLITSILGGAILHKAGLRLLISGGLGLTTVGIVMTTIFFPDVFSMLFGLFVTGMGLGFVMAVASTAIIGNVPHHEAGMASSVEEISYEVGSLTAVAFLGSLAVSLYSSRVHLPSGAPAVAEQSLSDASTVAAQLPHGGEAVMNAAASAYDAGYVIIMIALAIIVGVFTIITARLLRHHGPGSE